MSNLTHITSNDEIEAEREALGGNDELFRRSEYKPKLNRFEQDEVSRHSNGGYSAASTVQEEDHKNLSDVEKGEVQTEAREENVQIGSTEEKNEWNEKDHSQSDADFQVTWLGPDDPSNPQNWGVTYRWILTLLGGLCTLNATFSSSAPSENVAQMKEYFGFGQEVGILVISLFICGYIAGPLFWGPASEVFGRRYVFIAAYIPNLFFTLGGALAKNTATILIMRLLAGTFAACPVVISGSLLADIWDAKRRGVAMSVFALTPFAGPAIGPIVGGFIAVTKTKWQWTFWVMTIFAGACTVMLIFFLPETYAPVLHARNAAKKRAETGDNRYWAAHEKKDKSIKFLMTNSLISPFKMLVQEPMLLAISAYMSFIYGLVYLQFESFGFIFGEVYGLSAGLVGCCFLTIFVGGVLANLAMIFYDGPRYSKKVDEYAPNPVPPEVRLPAAIVAGILFPVSLFWLGWTSYASISLASPILAATLTGSCILILFLSLINYTVDAYLFKSATALAALTTVRSVAGAGFPLFADQMYSSLGVHWATTILGCVALLGMPLPMILIKFGPKLRKMSKNAADL